MQPLLTRLRSLRRERFDSSTGRRRRGGVALAAGIAIALFAGSGIAVAAVSSASAHTPAINSDCTGVHVQAWDYNDAVVNTVTVTIKGGNPDGTDRVENRTFGKTFDEWFYFADPSIGWSYSALIDAPDGADGTEWDYGWSDTTKGCSTPDIGLTASQCIHKGDLATVTATISPLDPAHAYTVRLIGTNGYDSGDKSVQTTSYAWPDLTPGFDYTATLTDTTSGLTDSDTVYVIGCPEDPVFDISVTQCQLGGTSGLVNVTVSGLVAGRNYVLSLISAAGGAPADTPFQATGPSYSTALTANPGGSYTVTITDVADGTSKTSNPVTLLPCPKEVSVDVSSIGCTSTNGVSNGSLAWATTTLVPGRSYTLTVTVLPAAPGDPTPTVYTESVTPALSSNWSKTLTAFAPGGYAVTLTDTTVPGGPTATSNVFVTPCPTQPEIALTPKECTVPGGSSELTATITGNAPTRWYEITLYEGVNVAPVANNPVPPQVRVDGSPIVVSWTGLKPGVAYRVVVVDKDLPDIKAAADILLKDCPGNPGVFLTQPQCTVLTVSTITVGVNKLIVGETYTVSVTKTSDGSAVPGVPAQTITPTQASGSLQFTNLPVGTNYTITVTNATKTLKATGTIQLILCDLPTLAYTGASTMTPTMAGLGFLQFGLVLVGISLVRRRSGAREV